MKITPLHITSFMAAVFTFGFAMGATECRPMVPVVEAILEVAS